MSALGQKHHFFNFNLFILFDTNTFIKIQFQDKNHMCKDTKREFKYAFPMLLSVYHTIKQPLSLNAFLCRYPMLNDLF